MWVIPIAAYVIALLTTIAGIQFHINIFHYPIYVLTSLTLAVFIPLSIIFLLPVDYISHNVANELPLFSLPDNVILILWKSNYWTTFLLTWLLLPVLQEFYRSGHYNKLDKLKDALKKNMKFQLIILSISVLGVLYLMVESGLTLYHIKLMIIAISHIYSLVLALWLMAHGLINLPKNKWIQGNHLANVNQYYLKVPKAIDNLEDTKISFKEEILQVLVLTKNFTSDSEEDFRFRDWILSLYDKIPQHLKSTMENQYLENSNNSITRDQLTPQFMTKLTANFNLNLSKMIAYEAEFDSLLVTITKLEDIIEARSNSANQIVYRLNNHRNLINPRATYVFQIYIAPALSRMTSVILFIGSITILQSEFFHSTHLSLINYLIHSTGIKNHHLLQLFVSSVFFSYMLFSSLNSLTHLKIFNIYHLVPHNSDIVSACFYTTYIARLTIPLSYNFITLFFSRESIFEQWFGKSIHLTGLFNLMNNWIPRFILIPVILAMFNVYDKLKKKLGLHSDLYDSWVIFDNDENDDPSDLENMQNKRRDLIIVEAKRIINREMFKRQQQRSTENLRPFNLSQAANINYENNRRNFHESLTNQSSGRIDEEEELNTQLGFLNNPLTNETNISLWGRLGGAFSGLRSSVSRFAPSGYRDEVEDPTEFDYDEDAEERLVL